MRDTHGSQPSSADLGEYLPPRDARDISVVRVAKPARANAARKRVKGTSPAVLAAAILAVIGPLIVTVLVLERKTDAKIAAAVAKAKGWSTAAASAGAPSATADAPAGSTGAAPPATASAAPTMVPLPRRTTPRGLPSGQNSDRWF